MKIAIYSGAIPSSTFIEHLITGVSEQHHVYLFGTLRKKYFKSYLSRNIFVYSNYSNKYALFGLTAIRLFSLILKYPNRLRPLISEVSKFKGRYNKWRYFSKFLPMVLYRPDILHIQWAKDIEYYGFLQKTYNIKIVLSLLGSHINYSPITNPSLAKVYRQHFPGIKAFHAVSEAIKLEATKYGASKSKIKIIRSPIPKLFFDSYKTFNKKENENRINIVSVGRFHWVKGIIYGIQAVSILKNKGYDVKYTIIGVTTVPEEILFEIKNSDLKQNIEFIPAMTQLKLIQALQAFDMLILPSIMEGIANVVLESMAVGLPVISSDCGGMNEVVIPKKTGWLVPVRDSEALANTIVEVYQTPQPMVRSITENAHEFVKKNYIAEKSIEEFISLYQQVLKK